MEQLSTEWFAARLGKVTASRIGDLMAKTKTGPSASRQNYMAELVTERLTGLPTERFTSPAMQHGTITEPQARAMYSLETADPVLEVGFLPHPTIAMAGASPDGMVGERGMVEIKCPSSATHIATLRGDPIDRKYLLQMQWQMACAERDWCDFASFDPRLPAPMQLHIRRVERDDDLLVEIEAEVTKFLGEVEAAIADLQVRYLAEAA